MTRARLAALAGLLAASTARAQLVPLSRCAAAIPCSIPFGLRPADAAALSPYSRAGGGNAGISVATGVEEGFKPRLVTRAIAEDPSERAARLFVRHNPLSPSPTPTPVR